MDVLSKGKRSMVVLEFCFGQGDGSCWRVGYSLGEDLAEGMGVLDLDVFMKGRAKVDECPGEMVHSGQCS